MSFNNKLTAKQRAYLKGLANSIDNRYLLGKDEPDEAFFDMVDKALEAHELIKISILQNSETDKNEIAGEFEKVLNAGIVQIIGRVIILYRPSKKNPRIKL